MSAAEKAALPAKVHPLVRAFLDDPGAVRDVVRRFGSPAHLVFPQVFAENLERLRSVLRARLPDHRICYAHKVNRSRALLVTAAAAGVGVDVASAGELAAARRAGFGPERIEVTGPKGERLLRELVGAGVTVNVDNVWELGRLAELAAPGAPVPVLVRVGGFAGSAVSRFGVAPADIDTALRLLDANRSRIVLRGFAFHLDSGEVPERVRAVQECLALCERACDLGLAPTVLDVGGGLRQVFTADAEAYDGYVAALRESLRGRGPRMTWGGNTFGYQVDDTGVHGTPVFHKYGNTVTADRMLDELLTAPLPAHDRRSVAQVIGDNLLQLWLEPGKSLADHAGITVAAVEFVKNAADGSTLVNLDLSRDCVTPADQEVMVDPLLLPGAGRGAHPGTPVGVFLAGQLCLERDLITNHLVRLPWLPEPGDLVVFPNTAAYHSDLSAASAALHPPVPKLAVTHGPGGFTVCPDSDYRAAGATTATVGSSGFADRLHSDPTVPPVTTAAAASGGTNVPEPGAALSVPGTTVRGSGEVSPPATVPPVPDAAPTSGGR
ncbi:type III PLP-dependent enzyme domain-containing protein [Nocardia stercoris]|uniref:Decarboxylase n=1 Tax=Nocardia stercoris TaxID=2483361 RepID=A0A3M2LC11_9NOCA|nr:alanine racemase [Nocardia stercoris]RMI33505.1 decarboxylase [Nocardia stercoris]